MKRCLNEHHLLRLPCFCFFFCRNAHIQTLAHFHSATAGCKEMRSPPSGHIQRQGNCRFGGLVGFCLMLFFSMRVGVGGGLNNREALISDPFTAWITLLPKFLMQDSVQGLCGPFIMAFIYVVPLSDLTAHHVRGRLCLFGSVLWHCGAPCSPRGKSSLHCPTLLALSVTGEGWIRDQKNVFFPPAVRLYLLWVPVARHNATHQLHAAGFFRFVGPGPLHLVPLLKPNHLVHMFSRLSKYKRVCPLKI